MKKIRFLSIFLLGVCAFGLLSSTVFASANSTIPPLSLPSVSDAANKTFEESKARAQESMNNLAERINLEQEKKRQEDKTKCDGIQLNTDLPFL